MQQRQALVHVSKTPKVHDVKGVTHWSSTKFFMLMPYVCFLTGKNEQDMDSCLNSSNRDKHYCCRTERWAWLLHNTIKMIGNKPWSIPCVLMNLISFLLWPIIGTTSSTINWRVILLSQRALESKTAITSPRGPSINGKKNLEHVLRSSEVKNRLHMFSQQQISLAMTAWIGLNALAF